MIFFEHPFNEHIRAYLRLEYLFDRLLFAINSNDIRLHQLAVSSFFDIIDLIERSDIKGAILQDLEKQRLSFLRFREHNAVNQKALEGTLTEIKNISARLITSGRPGNILRDNEWLNSVRSKLLVYGCAAQSDMPSYHFWQHKPDEERRNDLLSWFSHISPLFDALKIVLELLRESGEFSEFLAEKEGYKQMLGGKIYQLLRVGVDRKAGVFPEISANKHMIWIRFSLQDENFKSKYVKENIVFDMALCK
ncbi:MAG: cell division protein ZapD [Candidatus Kinetoplastibacterium crithidii]|nr:MAG: cell division protein ZapD [Candidatus Kinetoplastibacterium crithidii]